MKKLVLTIALVTSLVTLTYAQSIEHNCITASTSELAMVQVPEEDVYVDVKFENLSPILQAAINAYADEHNLKSITYNKTKKLTKVTLVAKADGSEKVIILDEEGKEI